MLFRVLILAAVLAAVPASDLRAEDKAQSARELLHAGARAHDEGKYDEAIALYEAALRLTPGDPTTSYELALSLQSAGRFADCVKTSEPLWKLEGRDRIRYLTIVASCTDSAGDHAKAAGLFDQALAEFPDDANLVFNAGLTRIATQEPGKAKELLKRSAAARPAHAASHLYLGLAFEQAGFMMPALLANLRFLTLTPEDRRAPSAAQAIGRILQRGIEPGKDGGTNLLFDPNASIEEGDYHSVELARILSGAAAQSEGDKEPSLAEKLVKQLDVVLRSIEETSAGGGSDFARVHYLPSATALRAAGLLEPFVYRSFAPLAPTEFQPWLKAHPDRVAALDAFVRAQGGQ